MFANRERAYFELLEENVVNILSTQKEKRYLLKAVSSSLSTCQKSLVNKKKFRAESAG